MSSAIPNGDLPCDDPRTSGSPEHISPAEIDALKVELWHARAAAVNAITETGRLRARNRELEALIHQLRTELDRLAHVEHSVTFRVGNAVVGPLRSARRLLR